MSDSVPRSGSTETAAAISEELLRIHDASYPVGSAAVATTHVTDDAVICFLDNLELQPSESFMLTHGEGELVLEMRRRFQTVVQTPFEAAVERATGRRVTHFFSETGLEPLFSIELFRLAPAAR